MTIDKRKLDMVSKTVRESTYFLANILVFAMSPIRS